MKTSLPIRTRLPSIESSIATGTPYVAYAYSYPHKTAYRAFEVPRRLADVWSREKRDALFLYLHVPFCEMRCGFCNLFTTANPRADLVARYVTAIKRQAAVVRGAIGPSKVARLAIGGGTPTFLLPDELASVLEICSETFGVLPGAIPMSVETSPRTAEPDRLAVLKAFGVDRISIGVQSFVDAEVAAAARAQTSAWVETAIRNIRDAGFPILNLDLIYGMPGQSVSSWLKSIRAALEWSPEELYLYPLYVRPLTGLDRRGTATHDQLRLNCYRAGRDMLCEAGYEQVSMRMFRRRSAAAGNDAPFYCCQEDGMLGLGCGARSYTTSLHYSNDYAVGSSGVREIIGDYVSRTDEQFAHVDYGCELDSHEQKRRWMIKSLFRVSGMKRDEYVDAFGSDVLADFAELQPLIDSGYFHETEKTLTPTDAGLEHSDALGPMLFSARVKETMSEFDLR